MASSFDAEDCLKASHEKLKNVILFVWSAFDNLIGCGYDNATNNEPFDAAHNFLRENFLIA